MNYENSPQSITLKELAKNRFSFAPSKYSNVDAVTSAEFEDLEKLITLSTERVKIQNDSKYNYLEIGDIDVSTGKINYKEEYGVYLPTSTPVKISPDDILISTVRTYRKGIAIVNTQLDNLVSTSAFLVIREVDKKITKEFLYAILRNNFFINQILSLQNRGMYPRLDRETTKLVQIPIPRTSQELEYITSLEKDLIQKQEEIQKKQIEINALIEKELLNNQLAKDFHYEFPNFDTVKSLSRLDTGIYSEEFLNIDFLIRNYKNGYYFIPENKIKSGNTPIKRFISEDDDLKFRWLTPTHFSDFGTILYQEKINCEKNNLNQNAMLLVNRTSRGGRGEYVGVGMFYDLSKYGNAQHNQGIYRVVDYSDDELRFMTCFMNFPLIRKYCAGMSVGSKMKEIKSAQFTTIPFPKFPSNIIKQVSSLYSDIIDFDLSSKNSQKHLDITIHNLVTGKKNKF